MFCIILFLALTLVKMTLEDIPHNRYYRLDTPIKPKAYSIAITPHFDTGDDTAFTFDGEVDIIFTTVSNTKQIKLHSDDLTFDASNVTVASGNISLKTTNPVEFDKNYTFAYINLEADLQVGLEYTLKISYTGPIRDDLTGFYRSSYFEKGVKKWLGATHLEPTHARRVFPCFDEPGLKATFTLTITRPESYKPTLSNTKLRQTVPLSNGLVCEFFHPTPVMSTYLVAFLVSEFEGVVLKETHKEFGIFTRPEVLNQTDYALNFGIRVLKGLEDYFGIDYYSTDVSIKLDHVALPEFASSGMQNWGLVKYIEYCLLYVPEVSTPLYKLEVANVIAHETAHMWFGNLVTCYWWSDIWLNEGFANYFQNYVTALIEPELGSANLLVTESVWNAYYTDEVSFFKAISHEVFSPKAIKAHFSSISYDKAGSIIRMMHHLLGDDAFKLGLNSYLNTNKFGSGSPTLLYDALNIGASTHHALSGYDVTDVAKIMSSWINQPGYPILHVKVNYDDGTVVLLQKRFHLDARNSSNEVYYIPITFTTQRSPDFQNTKPAFIMRKSSHTFSIAIVSQGHSWVLFNIQETGFYRVNYDDHSWELIAAALKSDHNTIHHLNRAKIVNDLFAFLVANEAKFDRLKNILEFLDQEDDYSVWCAVIRGLKVLLKMKLCPKDYDTIKAYALQLLDIAISRLSYNVRASDDFETLRNRMQVLEFACELGHTGCIEFAVNKFRALRENGTEITPSLRPVVYCNGLRNGDASNYDVLKDKLVTTSVVSEIHVIKVALTCKTDEGKVERITSRSGVDGQARANA